MKKFSIRLLAILLAIVMLAGMIPVQAGQTGFNSLKITGDTETPDTTAITVLLKDSSGDILLASGTTAPSAEDGYAKGCIFIDTDASTTSIFLTNQGTTSSCNFVSGVAATSFQALSDVTGAPFDAYVYPVSDGANLVAGIVIHTTTATSGNVLVADGTAWHSVTPDAGGLVAKTGTQTVAGDKTFSGATTFSSTVANQDDVTITGGKKTIYRAATEYLYSSAVGQMNLAAASIVQVAATTLDVNAAITASTSLTMESTSPIYFYDTDLKMYSSVDGQLDIDADTEVEIGTTTLDLNGALDVSGTTALGDNATFATDKAAYFRAATQKIYSAGAGTLDVISATMNICATASASAVTVGNETGASSLILKSGTGNTTISSTGNVDIDTAAAKDVTIDGGQVTIGSKDDAASAISMTTNVGTSETIVVTNTQGTAEGAIALTSTAGGVDINAATGKNVTVDAGQFLVTSIENVASAIALTTNTGANETIVLTNTQGTAEGAITLTSTAGGIDMDAATGKNVTVDAGQFIVTSIEDVASAISFTTNTGTSETITATNTQGTAEGAITLTSTAGGVDINAALLKDIALDGGQVAIHGLDDVASAISLATNTGTSETITVTNTAGTGEGAITLTSTAGGVDINAATGKNVTVDAGQFLVTSIENVASAIAFTTNTGIAETIVLTNTQGTDEGAIALNSTAGGIDINAATGKNVTVDAGQILVTSIEDVASAIALTTNTGTSETIVVTNTLGEAAGAITLNAAAGGVTISVAASKILELANGDAVHTVNIAVGNAVQTIHIADHATPANLIYIGGAASKVLVNAQAGVTMPAVNYGIDAAGTDDYVVTLSPAPTAYVAGMQVILNAGTANTGACTINVNGLGAKDIKNCDNADPANDDINASTVAVLIYNGTNFNLINPVNGH